jgi:hypothetical protein
MASSNRVGEPVWIAPSAAARIGGETLPPLILNALGTRTAIDARLDGSIQDGSIESTTKGAPTLTLSVLDPDGEMLNSDLFAAGSTSTWTTCRSGSCRSRARKRTS